MLLDKSFSLKDNYHFSAYIYEYVSHVISKVKEYKKLLLLDTNQLNVLKQNNLLLQYKLQHDALLLKEQGDILTDIKNVQYIQSNLFSRFINNIVRITIHNNFLLNDKLLTTKTKGIHIGDAVTDGNSIIGQVIKVNHHSVDVILSTNPKFTIYVQSVDHKYKMLAHGISNNLIKVNYIRNTLHVGDFLVSTGLDNTYPADMPVAKIISLSHISNDFNSALCTPVSNLQNLHFLSILEYKHGI